MRSRSEVRRRSRQWAIGSLIALVVISLSAPLWSGLAARLIASQIKAASRHYRVKHIVAYGLRVVPEADIQKLADIELGSSLYRSPVASAKKNIEKHPWIRYAHVRRRIPDTIEIRVVEREPVAALCGAEMLMVTSDSVVVAPAGANWVWDLPLLTPPRPIKPRTGSALTDAATLALLRETLIAKSVSYDLWKNLSEIYYRGGDIRATLSKPQIEFILGSGIDELAWEAAAEIVCNRRFTYDATKSCIDLRIPGRIIVVENMPMAEEQIHG